MSYHNLNDIELDLKRAVDSAKDALGKAVWSSYQKALRDAYELGSKSGFQTGFQAGLKEKCNGNHT
jgi:hypothetical protein